MNNKLMLIDGNSIINRAFYAMPVLTNKDGVFTNAVYGFVNMLFKFIEDEKPDYLAVTFDLHAPTFRHKKFDAYKGTRKEMPHELRPQIPLLKELLKAMDITYYEKEGYEADDLLGTMAKAAEKENMNVVIISGDRDLLQIATDKIKISIPKTRKGKTEIEEYYAADVVEKIGVTPTEYIDVKALMGDASDNIPGVPGIGEKTALKIIQQYQNIETAIENAEAVKPKRASENLVEFQKEAYLSKELATICLDAPVVFDVSDCTYPEYPPQAAVDMFARLEFKSLLDRIRRDNPDAGMEQKALQESYTHITSRQAFDALLAELGKTALFAFVLHHEGDKFYGASFYLGPLQGYFVEPSAELDEVFLLSGLKPVFENKGVTKITDDAKNGAKFLNRYFIHPQGIRFDIVLAGYLLDPTKGSYSFDSLASDYLNQLYLSEETVLGKGKSKRSIPEVPLEERVPYCANQAKAVFNLYPVLNPLLVQEELDALYYDIELPLAFVLKDMESYGIRVDAKQLQVYGLELDKKTEALTYDIYRLAGSEFNINSPKQLGEILFNQLGLKSAKKTKTGYSTDAQTLEKLADEHPIIEKILEFRTLAKLKSTYVDGLLAVRRPDTGKIYTTFNQTIAATGRLSSTEPNLQNIPIRLELGRELRKVFITDEGFVFVDGDYSQIELRVLAHISGDETLINAFKHGQDIHRLTASQVYATPYEQVSQAQRSNAKAVNFGIVYGISAFSLAKDLKITNKEAQMYIDSYFATYPKVRQYLDETIRMATQTGYSKTIFNRRRPMPELKSSNYNVRSFGERVAMNMPIQGTAADIIKIAMINVHHKLLQSNMKSRLLLQVHDELLVMAHESELEAIKVMLKNEMENAVALKLPLEVDIHVGKSWFDAK